MSANVLRVGAVQIDCQPGRVQENLDHAVSLVEAAAGRGAELVLLPELMPGGYCLTEALWDTAEPGDGRTAAWLASVARRLGVYLGTSFLEADGEHFYNTFALATPAGEIAGRVRKSPPASLEAYFYRAGAGPHLIETPLGRIGVGICYENLLLERLANLYEAGVDLVLQPAAAGRPEPFIAGDRVRFDRTVRRIAPYHARALGVPVVLADRCGSLHTALPGGYGPLDSSFPGLSCIADGNGRVLEQLGDAEGVIVADVRLDPSLKGRQPLRHHAEMWALPVPWYAFIWPMTQTQGERAYEQNARRRERARQISQAPLASPVIASRAPQRS